MLPVPKVEVLHALPDQYRRDVSDKDRPANERRDRKRRSVMEVAIICQKILAAGLGLTLTFLGIYTLYPLSSSVIVLPRSMLKLYAAFFGLTLTMIEGKAFLPDHNGLRQWFYFEFHFLSTARGRGFYYLLIASMALSLSETHPLYLICGVFMAIIALINIIAGWIQRPSGHRHYRRMENQFQTFTRAQECNDFPHRHHHHPHRYYYGQSQPSLSKNMDHSGQAPIYFNNELSRSAVPPELSRLQYDNPIEGREACDTLPSYMASYTDPLRINKQLYS